MAKNGTTRSAKTSKRVPWTTKDGDGLRKMRKTFGISQGQLGIAVGVTSSRICECERVDFPGGRHCSPGRELGDKIASHFAKLATQRKAANEREKVKNAKKREAKAKAKAEAKVETPVETTAVTA